MLENIGLIIVCNLLMYLIIVLITKFNNKISKKSSMSNNQKEKIEELNNRVEELEKKLFIQDTLNHAISETEINEKIYYISRIIDKYKDEPVGYYYRGSLYIKFEKYDDAMKDFDKTIEIDKNYKEAYRGKGVCLARKGYYY